MENIIDYLLYKRVNGGMWRYLIIFRIIKAKASQKIVKAKSNVMIFKLTSFQNYRRKFCT